MFAKAIPLFFFAFFAIVAVSAQDPTTTVTVTAAPTATTLSQCNTGASQCCNTVQSATSTAVSALTGLLGIALSDLNLLIGLGCTPITGVGLGQGANCAQQPVCCTNNSFGGLLSIGCTPISL